MILLCYRIKETKIIYILFSRIYDPKLNSLTQDKLNYLCDSKNQDYRYHNSNAISIVKLN